MTFIFDINFIFRKDRLKDIPAILKWISDRSLPQKERCRVRFTAETERKGKDVFRKPKTRIYNRAFIGKYNFRTWPRSARLEFSLNPFGISFPKDNEFELYLLFRRTKGLEKSMETHLKASRARMKCGKACLGPFYLELLDNGWFAQMGPRDSSLYGDHRNFTVRLNTTTDISPMFRERNKALIAFLEAFCRKFRPGRGFFTVNYKLERDCVFWPPVK